MNKTEDKQNIPPLQIPRKNFLQKIRKPTGPDKNLTLLFNTRCPNIFDMPSKQWSLNLMKPIEHLL